jgi:hypothetical protein
MAEDFLRRWSRLKNERAAEPPQEPAQEMPVEKAPDAVALPPVEKLTPESDFKPFMSPEVEDKLRRGALKKLFRDPHFNAADPFEPFSGDWTVGEPIGPEMLASLNQAQQLLFSEERKAAEKEVEGPLAQEKPESDEPGKQDA